MSETMTDEILVLEARAAALAQRIPLIVIRDQASLEEAVEDRAEIKRRLARINELRDGNGTDGIVSAIHFAWKNAVARFERLRGPYIEADKAYSRAMGAYEQEQARLRHEAEERARRERERLEAEERARVVAEQARLRKEEEDRRLAEASVAEARGDTETAERIIAAPIETPTVAPRPVFVPVAPVAPKPAAEGLSFRDNWTAEVTDLALLVKAIARGEAAITLVVANQPALNGMARSLRGALALPGVRAVNERIAAQRTR